MTWNSSCSIASDDENSRHSFLSDCDSEFDLRPPPRYPAEKRSYTSLNKQPINRIEPPLTRSRARAMEKSLIAPQPLTQQKRQSALRRSVDTFTGMASALTSSLNTSSILFPQQESANERVPNAPLDGVNVLADRFESCSLDEGRLNKNCVWPSRETNRHYRRPITSSLSSNTFGATPFSTLFAQPTTPPLFGQQQAQLWSRFRFAASTLRDNLWIEQTETASQQPLPNIFTSNHNYLFNLNDQSSLQLPAQTVPTRVLSLANRSPLSLEEPSSALFRQRKTPSMPESAPVKETTTLQHTSSSKLFFTLTIFVIGLTLGYLLTNTLPPSLVWKLVVNYVRYFCLYIQATLDYLAS